MNLLSKEQQAINDIKVFIERGKTSIDMRPLYFACNQSKELCVKILKEHIKEPVWFQSFNGGMRIDYWIRLDGFDVERYYIKSYANKELSDAFYPKAYEFYDWSVTKESAENEFKVYDIRKSIEADEEAKKQALPWYKNLFKRFI